jgi:anti-sigma factor RsiW
MAANLTCTQVSALLSFYIDDKLSSQLKQFVEAHLEICPTCRTKLETLRSMVKSLREAHEKISAVKSDSTDNASEFQNEEFKMNLSAYIDNELSDEENIKLKKYVISNPKARQELEGMYNLKKVLHESFEKTKNESKDDFSRFVLRQIDIQEEVYGNDSFAKVVALFIVIFTVFTLVTLVIIWV